MTRELMTALVAAALLLSSPAMAQDVPADDEANALPTPKTTAAELTDEELAGVLEQLSPEQVTELIDQAVQRRLAVERKQVAEEIRQNILYDEETVAKAEKALDAPSASKTGTRAENIQRICQAYAAVDDAFAVALRHYEKKEYAVAAEALKELAAPESSTYRSAAAHFLLGDALVKSGKKFKGTEVWGELLVNQPDRISFAAEAAMRSAKAYESMRRGMYALEMYTYCLNNYSLSLEKDEAEGVYKRSQELRSQYTDPIKTVTTMMADLEGRLDRAQTGKPTQEKHEELVALLEDLIQTAEERQRQKDQQNQQNQNQQQGKRKGGQKKGAGQQQQQQQAQGRNPSGKPSGTGAKKSALVPGPVSKPNLLARQQTGSDAGKWAELPAREREQIRELMQQRLGQRRGQQVRDYHRRLAETPSE